MNETVITMVETKPQKPSEQKPIKTEVNGRTYREKPITVAILNSGKVE